VGDGLVVISGTKQIQIAVGTTKNVVIDGFVLIASILFAVGQHFLQVVLVYSMLDGLRHELACAAHIGSRLSSFGQQVIQLGAGADQPPIAFENGAQFSFCNTPGFDYLAVTTRKNGQKNRDYPQSCELDQLATFTIMV